MVQVKKTLVLYVAFAWNIITWFGYPPCNIVTCVPVGSCTAVGPSCTDIDRSPFISWPLISILAQQTAVTLKTQQSCGRAPHTIKDASELLGNVFKQVYALWLQLMTSQPEVSIDPRSFARCIWRLNIAKGVKHNPQQSQPQEQSRDNTSVWGLTDL